MPRMQDGGGGPDGWMQPFNVPIKRYQSKHNRSPFNDLPFPVDGVRKRHRPAQLSQVLCREAWNYIIHTYQGGTWGTHDKRKGWLSEVEHLFPANGSLVIEYEANRGTEVLPRSYAYHFSKRRLSRCRTWMEAGWVLGPIKHLPLRA